MFFDDSELGSYREGKGAGSKAAANIPTALTKLQYAPAPRRILSPEEIEKIPLGSYVAFDVELYYNYLLVAFQVIETGDVFFFEHSCESTFQLSALNRILWSFRIVGFNSKGYDLPIIERLLEGASLDELKELSDGIILRGERPRCKLEYNHIDLIEVAPLQASLKAYGARLHSPRIQELPIDPNKYLTQDEAASIRDYCFNDLDNTVLLWRELLPQMELRIELSNAYNIDLRSKSDAQIAEAVINSELEKLTGVHVKRPDFDDEYTFRYDIPEFITYNSPDLRAMLDVLREIDFELDAGGSPAMPKELSNMAIRIGGSVYRMGIGGLHSSEKNVAHIADAETLLLDRDVASYYPRIILNQRLYPEHLGEAFLKVFDILVERRLDAKARAVECKKAGDKEGERKWKAEADALKITINGCFGKLGNAYSTIYSPKLLSQVTISGQLYLLMLIDMIEYAGIPVVSANTDGIVIKCPVARRDDLNAVIAEWERRTQCETEETEYAALYSRDVNNYIAIKTNGETKPKGVYSERGSALNSPLSKNPETQICSDAVQKFLSERVPVEQTIRACTDIRKFVAVKNVQSPGAHKNGVFLGKVIRWYYAEDETGEIFKIKNGHVVGKTDGAKPLMQLDGLPADIKFEKYIETADAMLVDLGARPKPQAPSLFA